MKKLELLLKLYKTQIQTACSLENIVKYSSDDEKFKANINLENQLFDIDETEEEIKTYFKSLEPTICSSCKDEERGIEMFENQRQDC